MGKKTGKDIPAAVREICLWFPQTEEVYSHGSPDFRIAGKTFATFAVNHHGDGHLALWLRSPPGAQQHYADAEPEHFYVPPYVGPKGWLGVDLDRGLSWTRISELVREAAAEVAPAALQDDLRDAPVIEPPTHTIDPEQFDPFNSATAQQRLHVITQVCSRLPEVTRDTQFGNPCFRAGKKNFCTLHFRGGRLQLSVWVGADRQGELTFDERFSIPAYTGHNGWLDLDIHDELLGREAEVLIVDSYRHFALKRMLKVLPEEFD